jgi:hypothetical protein
MLVVGLASGCAIFKKGPSDEEQIKALLDQFKAAAVAKDVTKVMTLVSDNFQHPEGGSKEEVKGLLEQGIDMGYADKAEVDLSVAKIEVKKDGTASAGPIPVSSVAGEATATLNFTKEKAGWFVTGVEVDGI